VNLQGRAALVTGGARMGEAVAAMLADGGADVAFTYRMSADAAEQGAAAVKARGRRALTLHANLGDPLECRTAVNEAAAAFGRLDILVNMASLYAHVPFDEEDEDHWDRQLSIDLRATFLCCRAAVPHMRLAGGGRIVNFSDWIAASGRPRYTGYVLVNAVAPGPIVAPPGTTAKVHAAVERATPLGRWGGEDEVAKAVGFLVTSDFVTGETIRVDGGRHVK
jgi:NAD(P)-dependent dehydrogenase (short-subunit alcohol dehydrogenase family)